MKYYEKNGGKIKSVWLLKYFFFFLKLYINVDVEISK